VPAFVISKAASAMTDAGYAGAADELIAATIDRDPTPPVARLYVDRAAARGDWSFLDRLPALVKRGEVGREVLHAAVDALGTPARRARLHELLRQFGDEIRHTHRGWAKAAGALVEAGDHAAAVTWAADWQTRKPDEPWMLHPVAVAFRQLGRLDDARRVTVFALDLPAEDPTTPDFRVWLAFEEAMEGRTDRAEGLLADIDEDDLDDVPRILHALSIALVTVQRNGRPAFAEARDKAKQAVPDYAPKAADSDLLLSYRRWAKRLAADAGGVSAWLWAAFKGKYLPGS
jgi:hypothetical protein